MLDQHVGDAADPAAAPNADLYSNLQSFYSVQMGLLDEGDGDAWSETYTEDAVFLETRMPAPLEGREAIRTSVHGTIAKQRESERVFRHWFGMLVVDPQDDGTVRTRCYALTLTTPYGGGSPEALGHAVLRDHLVPGGAHGWLVRRREIAADGV